MLRLSVALRIAVAAAALFASIAALSQGGGLDGRITDAGTKLDQDTQACKPINLGEYAALLNEAGQNAIRAKKAAKAGVPINQAQVDADLANASALFNRAQAALVQQCMRAAQGQAQAQPQTMPTPAGTPTPATTPTPAVTPAQSGVGTGGTDSAIGVAENKLAEDIKACRPINVSEYDALAEEAHRNAMAGIKAARVGAPVDTDKLRSDLRRADALLERAKAAEAAQKACPPKREAQTEPPPKTSVQPAQQLNRSQQAMLDAHNELRARVGSPPLQWGPVQEQHAIARAGEMARTGEFTHAPREGRGTERENISQAPPNYSPVDLIRRWGQEIRFLKPGLFPDVSTTGNWMDIAHVAQMLWSRTVAVGCGAVAGYFVCRYSPGGNKDGQAIVQPPITPRKPVTDLAGDLFPQSGGQPSIAKEPDQAASALKRPMERRMLEAGLIDPYDYRPPAAAQHGEPANAGRTASMFDLGIYAGGAWTTDWFDLPPSESPSQMALNHEYGYDSALFVGYDLGAFRIEAEVAYKAAYQVEGRDMSWMSDILFSPLPTYVDTNVEQPQLPKGETFKPDPPQKLEDPM